MKKRTIEQAERSYDELRKIANRLQGALNAEQYLSGEMDAALTKAQERIVALEKQIKDTEEKRIKDLPIEGPGSFDE